MKIDPTAPLGTPPARRKDRGRAASSGDFAKHIGGESPAAQSVGAQAPVSAVDALISLQEVGDSTSEQANARAQARGRILLDHLDEIRHGLLLGSIPRRTLTELSKAARAEREAAADPKLAEVLDEIELRAEVELAKLDY